MAIDLELDVEGGLLLISQFTAAVIDDIALFVLAIHGKTLLLGIFDQVLGNSFGIKRLNINVWVSWIDNQFLSCSLSKFGTRNLRR